MKKEQVFVVIDTEKKAKKVAVLLHMFRQYESGYHTIRKCLSEQACLCYNVQCDYWHWSYYDDAIEFRKEVSVSELKQIIAMDLLKKGDVVVCDLGNEKWIVEFSHFSWPQLVGSKWNYKGETHVSVRGGYFDKFIRYATEEEKKLLNTGAKKVSVCVDRDVMETYLLLSDKFTNDLKMLKAPKEIVKVKINGSLSFDILRDHKVVLEKIVKDNPKSKIEIFKNGNWKEIGCLTVDDQKEDEKHTGSFESLRKCDSVDFPNDFKEVETKSKEPVKGVWRFIKKQEHNELHKVDALIFDNGNDLSFGFNHVNKYTNSYGLKYNLDCFIRDATPYEVSERFFKECHDRYPNKIGFSFNNLTNEIISADEIIFKNGTWLEAKKIEIDPLKELKEAHKKGFEIEYKSSSGQWKTSSNPAWRKTGNYRIRPVKIGDWFFTTHEQTNVKYYYQVNETNINDVKPNHVRILNQMVIDILNNGKYTV